MSNFQAYDPADLILSPRLVVTGGDPGSSLEGVNTHKLANGSLCVVQGSPNTVYQLQKSASVGGVAPVAGPGRWFPLAGGPIPFPVIGQDAAVEDAQTPFPEAAPFAVVIPRNAALDPMEVVFPSWTPGDVLEVAWTIGFGPYYGPSSFTAEPIVSTDNGVTWLAMVTARASMAMQVVPDGGQALPIYKTYVKSSGVVTVAATGPVRVRLHGLQLPYAVPDQPIYTFAGPGIGYIDEKASTQMCCKRWPASQFVQGPVGTLEILP